MEAGLSPESVSLTGRLKRFAGKPWRSQFRSVAFRWIRILPGVPLPMKLSFGAWWLLRNDQISAQLLEESFENEEKEFVDKFLRPGMTVLDIGANQGYYTLLASKKVGAQGKVVAFEPTPREAGRLRRHLRLNSCKNVEVVTSALGNAEGHAELHMVMGSEAGCHSLRPPDVAQPTSVVTVKIERLDEVLKARGVERVDFIKLDVEGAELSVLQGAQELLSRSSRPVMLVEVQDLRTKPWGYAAREIITYLVRIGYRWYRLGQESRLESLAMDLQNYDGNFVAIPEENRTFRAGILEGCSTNR
jgi:FkbM family methyltransferase